MPFPACQVGIMCCAVGLQKSKHIHCTQRTYCLMEKRIQRAQFSLTYARAEDERGFMMLNPTRVEKAPKKRTLEEEGKKEKGEGEGDPKTGNPM